MTDPYDLLRAIRALIHRSEVRLLHVVVPDVSRSPADALIQVCRALDENAWEICPLLQPHERGQDGWNARVERLVQRYASARAEDDTAGKCPAIALVAPNDDGVERFIQQTAAYVKALPAPLAGLMLHFCPTMNRDPATWESAIERLIDDERLARVRLVVLETANTLGDLPQRLGERARSILLTAKPAEIEAAIDHVMKHEVRTVPDARGPAWVTSREDGRVVKRQVSLAEMRRGAQPTPATPAPPPQPDATQILAALAEWLDPASILLRAEGLSMRTSVERATNAFVSAEYAEALGIYDELLRRFGGRLSLQDRTVLANERARSLVALGRVPEAISAVTTASDRAESQHPALAAAGMASAGALYVRLGNAKKAAEAYGRAARIYVGINEVGGAVGVLRSQGHAAMNAGDPEQGLAAWRHALRLLDGESRMRRVGGPPPIEAVHVARALAECLEERGDRAGASALRGHADAIERSVLESVRGRGRTN